MRGLSRRWATSSTNSSSTRCATSWSACRWTSPAINIARGRSEGIASLNNVRKQLFAASHDAALKPYDNWFDFGQNLKHHESLVNFIAAYGTDPTITGKTTSPTDAPRPQAM